jgi:hypothetical protein
VVAVVVMEVNKEVVAVEEALVISGSGRGKDMERNSESIIIKCMSIISIVDLAIRCLVDHPGMMEENCCK